MSERILIIRLGALGDVANVMSAVAGLRRVRPKDHIAWLVEESAGGLVALTPQVDEMIVFPRRSYSRALRRPWLWPWLVWSLARFTGALNRRRFDRVLDFQAHLKSGLLAWRTGAPWRAGYSPAHGREGSHLFMTERVTPLATAVSRRDRAVALAQALEPGLRPECPRLTIKREDEEVVAGFLAGLPSGQRVVIHPGSSRFGRFKRWPAERWGLLARHLADARQAVAIVTRGPDEDEETIRQVLEASKGAASPAPRLTLPQLVALLRRVDLFVGADSGPLHIAGLVGAPCVAVFGPKDPAVYAPAGARVVRREDLPCSPCVRRSCRRLDCLLGLDVNAVAEAAIQELDRRPPISR